MTIRIRQTPYTRSGGAHVGPYAVRADDVRAQLGVIAMAGDTELPGDLGEVPDDADFTRVTYAPPPQDTATPRGRVRTLLRDLANDGTDVRLFGMGDDFVWSDGTTLRDSAGGAIGDWIFYDTRNCGGDGRWVRGTDGEQVCTTSAGILFHELGHVRLNHPAGTVDQDERAAVGIENDLRQAEGLVPRDPDHWPESDCGCPGGCCIVASVASGSPFSAEVHALRRVRDGLLRRTAIGHHLFEALHREYYGFSVAVCRVMVRDADARGHVEAWLVHPLVRALELALRYARDPDDADALARQVRADADAEAAEGRPAPPGGWALVAAGLGHVAGGGALPAVALPGASTGEVYGILREWLPRSPHVRWAIVDVLRIYAAARARVEAGDPGAGEAARAALEAWIAELPLDAALEEMDPVALAADLERLGADVVRAPAARRRIGARVMERMALDPASAAARRLRAGGFLP